MSDVYKSMTEDEVSKAIKKNTIEGLRKVIERIENGELVPENFDLSFFASFMIDGSEIDLNGPEGVPTHADLTVNFRVNVE